MDNKYLDIINLPPHHSLTHKRMSISDRSAQFMPFKSLTGFDELIIESSKQNVERKILTNDKKEEIEKKLNLLKQNIKTEPEITITYYINNNYETFKDNLIKIDEYHKTLIFKKHQQIKIKDIMDINTELEKIYFE